MSKAVDYRPIRGPASNTTVEQMFEKLAQHQPTRPAMPVPLEWEKPARGATGVKTLCGKYSVSKTTVMGEIVYGVWKLGPGTFFKQIATRLPTYAKAQEAAQTDSESKHGL